MSKEKNESVTITYKNDKITMKGKTFTATLSITGSELSKVYWGNEGKGTVKMVFDGEIEEKKPENKPVVVAEKKSPEEPVETKTETSVQRTTASVRKPAARKPRSSSSASDDFMKNFGK